MMKKPIDLCSRFADLLCDYFAKGLTLDVEIIKYIDSTFGVSTAEELSAILEEDAGAEVDSLIELILFPDLPLQIFIEPFLAEAGFSEADEAEIIESIGRREPSIRLDFGGKGGTLSLRMDRSAAAAFIHRLHIQNSPHPRLIAAIDGYADELIKAFLKVEIRNSRLLFSESRLSFLCRLITAIAPATQADAAPILFSLDFLQELAQDADDETIFEELVLRKHYLTHLLNRAQDFERKRQAYNMEILILQGGRMPHIDIADTRQKIGMIDDMAWAIYRKFIPAQEGVERMEVSAKEIRSIPY